MVDDAKTPSDARPLDRRTFLELAVGAGAAAGVSGCLKLPEDPKAGTADAKADPSKPTTTTAAPAGTGAPKPAAAASDDSFDPSAFTLPGPFPGRVIEIHHPGSMLDGNPVRAAVSAIVAKGMAELTGAPDATAAWKRFFSAGDVVGIKLNPVGNSKRKDRRPVISSNEAVLEVVEGLKSAGVKPTDIVLFERYRDQFMDCGWHKLAQAADVHWDCAAVDYDNSQLDLEGYSTGDSGKEKEHGKARTDGSPAVSGYDPAIYKELDFVHPGNNPADPRSRRSHLCNIVSRRVNKVINMCLLKDHASAGVTGALKNISHGFVNNVSRSHGSPGLNQCHTFIPAIVGLNRIRRRVVLNIMEGLVGMYQGGPGSWNAAWAVWEYKSMFFSTDPVAMDRIAWTILDARRGEAGMPPLAKTGLMGTGVRGVGGVEAETFDYRQVQHIELAGLMGLGVFARNNEEWRKQGGRAGDKPALIEHRRTAIG